MNDNRFALYKMVWYDGTDAFVTKIILESYIDDYIEPTTEARCKVDKYLNGNGDLLKLDYVSVLTLHEIAEFERINDLELNAVFERFDNMYF